MKRIYLQSHTLINSLVMTLILMCPQIINAQIKYDVGSPIPYTKFEDLLVAILNIFIIIATPIIVLYIIYAGFLYVTAKGNVQQIQQATQALTYAIIGGVLVIGAVALSQVIANIVGAFTAA